MSMIQKQLGELTKRRMLKSYKKISHNFINGEKKTTWNLTKEKFVVLRYGKDLDIKESTTYFSGDTDEVIEEKDSTRDLGVIMQNDGGFSEHIEKICSKVRQKSGWMFRTFYSRQGWFLRHMWNSLIQPHIDYCSQLWAPSEGGELMKIEKLLKDYTARIPEVSEMNYWERLKHLK